MPVGEQNPRDDEVKVETFYRLRTRWLTVKSEVRLAAMSPHSRSANFSVDLAVYGPDGRLAVVIEAKGSKDTMGSRQRENYLRCGVPALLVTALTMDEVVDAVAAFIERDAALPEHLKVSPIKPQAQPVAITAGTWLTAYAEAWKAAYQGVPPFGRIGRALRPLHLEHGEEEVLRRFRIYLKVTPGRYASVERFAQTFGIWDGDAPARKPADPLDQRPEESVDAYFLRLSQVRR